MGASDGDPDSDAFDTARTNGDGCGPRYCRRKNLSSPIRGSETNGIVSNPFLEYAFRTESYTVTVSIHPDGTWSYEQDTVLIIPGQAEPFHHTDRNTLRKVGEPTLNPRARARAAKPEAEPR